MGFPNADFVDENGTSKVKYCKIGNHSELDTKKNDFLKLMVEPSLLTATEKTFQCKNGNESFLFDQIALTAGSISNSFSVIDKVNKGIGLIYRFSYFDRMNTNFELNDQVFKWMEDTLELLKQDRIRVTKKF